ncbi:hypothetical protein LAWI1_G008413 [Lachnellula willkommii]|uniref:Uncharacterized protein n=1 Tax=Lachnellula willkommii TaxID=215461 RepID=A0A559M010_9HELO|nr:hypothetical protein LAWI1_G008413 [Lachnellula willkommii]
MSANDVSHNGIIVPADAQNTDTMGKLAHAVLDDIVYNIIHDIVLKAHREEKMARASTAATLVEQKAIREAPPSDDPTVSATRPPIRVETETAIYDSGEVYIKGNPMKTTTEIICPKCHLPRLLYPTDGNGARKPEPGVEYCKKRPYIDKPYHDIYGQTFQMEGPGRGKKKKDMVNPLLQTAKEGTPSGSQDSPNPSPPPGEGPPKPISFPHAKCHNCNTFLPIKRMNNHMIKCIGGGGRDSSRQALLKIQNNGTSSNSQSQNGSTPPGSRTGTPAPSPNKRQAGDDFDSDSSPQKKKKVVKKTAATKLKAPKMARSNSQMSSSNLSFEQKAPNSEDDEEGEDEADGEYGTVVVEPTKKKAAANKPLGKKLSNATNGGEKKKKWLHGGKGGLKGNAGTPIVPGATPTSLKLKIKPGGVETKVLPPKSVVPAKTVPNGNGNGTGKSRAESESSQTLSSPN